jgi:hypothetical protein
VSFKVCVVGICSRLASRRGSRCRPGRCLVPRRSGLRRTKDLEARKQIIFDIQRYVAEQQHRVLLTTGMLTGSWQPYVKNYGPNQTFDYGSRAAALWLER